MYQTLTFTANKSTQSHSSEAESNGFTEIKKLITSFFRKKIVLFGLIMLPVGSAGAGISLYIDEDSNSNFSKPVILNETVINLEKEISLEFSKPIAEVEKYEEKIAIFPKENLVFTWDLEKTHLKITPADIWQPETEYTLSVPKLNFKENTPSYLFLFETLSYPKIIKTTPAEGEQGFVFDENNKISIQFNKNIDDFDIQVVSRPFIEVEQEYNSETQTLVITPLENVKHFGSHTITIFVKHKKQKQRGFFPIGALTFSTLLPTPEEWPEKYAERLLIARQSTVAKNKKGKYIDVNLEAQITTLFENGKFVESFINSTGAADTPTPTGTYQVYNKHPYALSNMFQVYMPYWMAFTSDGKYGFHDLPVWPEGHTDMPEGGKESIKSIGSPVGPGCVRHNAQDSQKMYEWADVGTKVVIY
ncbi:MAG: L,D-transpeptidase [Candidatus Moranbacteria bacterium]|nr:L,D-transpeptidase [Candidatus Moranbacteria bacterium]